LSMPRQARLDMPGALNNRGLGLNILFEIFSRFEYNVR
jgi:hypothetical protein